jgi:hypothetical protein
MPRVKKNKKKLKKDEPLRLDMSFEDAVKLALITPLPKKPKKKK